MVATLVALLVGVATAIAASDGGHAAAGRPETAARASVTTTAEGTVVARGTDRGRGLVFTVQSSALLRDNVLSVTLTRSAPQGTRRALLRRPLVGTCDVPGEHVREVAGRWNRRFRQYGTVLLTDRAGVKIASVATSCSLYVGEEGATPDTGVFPQRPFSRVRMR